MSNCAQCSQAFENPQSLLDFLERIAPVFNGKKISIPPPTLCTGCRLQRRLAHRNEKTLFERKCDKTGEMMISIHAPNDGYKVVHKDEWWSDNWDPLDFGRDFNFDRPFFEQFEELQKQVPRMSLLQEKNENSDYASNVSYLKNCYLLFSADHDKDCCYGVWIERSRDCFDNMLIDECERTYETIFSDKIYNSSFIYSCSQCRDSAFLRDCRGCSDCLMCWGLRNKQYHIANQPYSKEEYLKKLEEYPLSSYKNMMSCKEQFNGMIKDSIQPEMRKKGRVVDSTGDFLHDTENCINCFELSFSKDCTNTTGFQMKDGYDCTYANGEFAYETCECFPVPSHSGFDLNSYTGSNLWYCDLCMNNCQNMFGCVGFKKASYCILNKQYTQEEYEELVPKIIEHMTKTKEWGEFFPIKISPIGYNISEANAFFSLDKKGIEKNGWKWQEEIDIEKDHNFWEGEIPDDIKDVDESICEYVLKCEVSGKAYKIISQEFVFLKQIGLPIPRRHPDQRHKDRFALRNPRQLWERQCEKCKKDIQTTYSPERTERIYCEECYMAEVY